MKRFIRIIDGEEYGDYLSEKDYKYIPKKIIYLFRRFINSRIVCNYRSRVDNKNVGSGVGISLKQTEIPKEEYKEKLIDVINSLKDQEDHKEIKYLINENLELDYRALKEIEKECNIKIPSGKSIFAKNIISCLKAISAIKKEDISQKEVFIVSEDTKITEQLVDELSMSTKFIKVFTQNIEFGKRLEDQMFNKYGLSLHATSQIDKTYNNFDFIINLSEKPILETAQISKNKIVMDLSDGKILNRNSTSKIKRVILIDDIFLKNDENIYVESEIGKLDDSLNTSTSSLINSKSRKVEKLQVNRKVYNIEEIEDIFNFNKQNQSYFNKM